MACLPSLVSLTDRFAIAGWSLEGSSFALYTISNLVPRAYWVSPP